MIRHFFTSISRIFKWFLFLSMAATIAWLAMFATYVISIPNPYHDSQIAALSDADAIIVFTGDNGRIKEGMRLYRRLDYHPRILLSGVGRYVNKNRIVTLYKQYLKDSDLSRLELDDLALSTKDNIYRSLDWAVQKKYKKIIFVSSHYHFPRIELLLPSILNDAYKNNNYGWKDIQIAYYPIAPKVTSDNIGYYAWVYCLEFHKYLVTLFEV